MARRAGITHEDVVDAAAVVAERDGLAAVSVATVAAAVCVRAPSLYSHVEGRADPVAALRSIGHAYRAFNYEHPGLDACLLPVPDRRRS